MRSLYDQDKDFLFMSIKDETVEALERYGVKTGSRVIGGYHEGSDYDYVVDAETASFITHRTDLCISDPRLINWRDYPFDVRSHKFFTHDDKEINIIIVPDETDVAAWKYATEKTTGVSFKDKEDRTSTFEKHLIDFYLEGSGSLIPELFPVRAAKLQYKHVIN